MPERPKVFISSTVYDFRDLRSALKFWLEELGYDVLLSENPDFPVQVDLNSYSACLNAIDDCDYFVLLVGSRVGGWYDEGKRISITQAEYRRAYERLSQASLKLLTFVRQDLWDVREDRKELQRLLLRDASRLAELTDDEIAGIIHHPSKFANDAEFTFAFLNEIARIEEMKVAVAGSGPFPCGNWIHRFSEFRDIIDALRLEFRAGTRLRQVALLANLKAELASTVQTLSGWIETQNTVAPAFTKATYARRALQGGLRDSSRLKGKYLRWLAMFALFDCDNGRTLSTTALDSAISSGEFLTFDRAANSFTVGPMQHRLLELRTCIERLRRNEELVDSNARAQFFVRFKMFEGDQERLVDNETLVPVLSLHDIQANIIALCKALYRAADGDYAALVSVRLYGDSPIESETLQIQRERPTYEQVEAWLARGE